MSASIWSPDDTIPSEAPPDYVYKRIWIDIAAGQTLVDFASVDPTFVYTPGLQSLEVGIDGGMPLQPVVDYTETTTHSITLISTPTDADRLYAAVGRPINVSPSGVTAALVPYTFPDSAVRSVQDLATYLGTTGIGAKALGAGSVFRTQSDINEDTVRVTDYDELANSGTVDATPAILKAHNALPSAGGVIKFPAGVTYKMDSGVTFTKPVKLEFDSGGYRGGAAITVNFTTGNVFSASNIEGIVVTDCSMRGAAMHTSGAFFNLNGCIGVVIERFRFENYYVGISLNGGVIHRVRDGHFRVGCPASTAANGACVIVGASEQTVDSQIHSCTADNEPALMPSYGIFLLWADAPILADNDIIHCGVDLAIRPGNGQTVSASYIHDNYFDTANMGISIEPSAGGLALRNYFHDNWASSHTGRGITIAGAGTVLGTHFINTWCMFNGSDGLVNINGTELHVTGGVYGGNVGAGISIASNRSKFYLKDIKAGDFDGSGANAFGLYMDSGCTNYEMEGNTFSGNTNAAVNLSPAGGVVRNNIGYVTKNKGSANVAAGTSSITVTHGLATTPSAHDIWVTPNSSFTASGVSSFYITSVGATTFQIVVNTNVTGVAMSFVWQARCLSE